ncbi:MAG: hypothetical protein AAF288_08465 [Planctomycetota bacterium]
MHRHITTPGVLWLTVFLALIGSSDGITEAGPNDERVVQLLPVKLANGRWTYINREGQRAVEGEYEHASHFFGDTAIVQLPREDRKPGERRPADVQAVLDKHGNVLFETPHFLKELGRDLYAFEVWTDDGDSRYEVAPVGRGVGVTLPPGITQVHTFWRDDVLRLSRSREDIIALEVDDLWGYWNVNNNEWTLPPQYDYVDKLVWRDQPWAIVGGAPGFAPPETTLIMSLDDPDLAMPTPEGARRITILNADYRLLVYVDNTMAIADKHLDVVAGPFAMVGEVEQDLATVCDPETRLWGIYDLSKNQYAREPQSNRLFGPFHGLCNYRDTVNRESGVVETAGQVQMRFPWRAESVLRREGENWPRLLWLDTDTLRVEYDDELGPSYYRRDCSVIHLAGTPLEEALLGPDEPPPPQLTEAAVLDTWRARRAEGEDFKLFRGMRRIRFMPEGKCEIVGFPNRDPDDPEVSAWGEWELLADGYVIRVHFFDDVQRQLPGYVRLDVSASEQDPGQPVLLYRWTDHEGNAHKTVFRK